VIVCAGGCLPPILKTLNFCAGGVLPPWFVIILYALISPSTVIILFLSIFYQCKLSYCNPLPLNLSSNVM
jgi:hypothetical protein